MTYEEAEAIVSDPTGHSEAAVTEASAILGLLPEESLQAPISLTQHLASMEKAAETPAEKALLNELAVIVGEAKMRLAQVAKKAEYNSDHIAHAVLEYFQHL